MFYEATAFNQPLGSWDVGSVTGMRVRRAHMHSQPQGFNATQRLADVIIAGTPKGGTSTLYDWMGKATGMLPSKIKEINFFDRHFENGTAWYAGHWPSENRKGPAGCVLRRRPITSTTPKCLHASRRCCRR